MLKVKTKDELFNNRNEVDVDEIEAESIDLSNTDISVAGITSKGIANTGGFANIGNAVISGDFTAQGEGKGKIKGNTFEQVNPNWEIDIKDKLVPEVFASGSSIFAKMVIYNRTLHLVISGKYIQGSLTASNVNLVYEQTLDIPDEIASKIYRADGTNLTEAPSSLSTPNNIICSFIGLRQTSNTSTFYGYLNSNGAKKISIYAIGLGTLTEGQEYYLDLRLFLTL